MAARTVERKPKAIERKPKTRRRHVTRYRGLTVRESRAVDSLRRALRAILAPDTFTGLLGGGHKVRIQADYFDPENQEPVEFTRENAGYWLERVREFVAFVEASLETWLAEPPIEE